MFLRACSFSCGFSRQLLWHSQVCFQQKARKFTLKKSKIKNIIGKVTCQKSFCSVVIWLVEPVLFFVWMKAPCIGNPTPSNPTGLGIQMGKNISFLSIQKKGYSITTQAATTNEYTLVASYKEAGDLRLHYSILNEARAVSLFRSTGLVCCQYSTCFCLSFVSCFMRIIILFRDGQLKRMHVKESYREEKRKELGEIFATNEPNFEENGKPLDSVSEEPIFDETSNNESEDATENVLEMKKFPFEDKSENIENSNNEATVLSTLQGDQSSSNETVVKKSDLEVNSAYENDELMHSFESLESLPNSENTLEQSSNFESTSENFEQNSLSTSPAKLVSPNHIKGALAPG